MSSEEYLKKIVKGAGFIIIGLFLSKLLIYAFRILIARGLGPESYGTFNLGMAIQSILVVIALIGLNQGIIRYISYYKGKEDPNKVRGVFLSGLIISAILSIFLAVLLFSFSNYIAIHYFSNPSLSLILKILSIALPLNVISKIFLATLRADQKIKYVVYSQHLISTLSRLILATLAIYLGLNLVGVTWAYNLSILIMLVLSYYYIKKKVKNVLNKDVKPSFIFKKIFYYSWPLFLTAILYDIMYWTDSLMVGYFKDSSSVGIYNSAAPTAHLVHIFPVALIILFLPIISYLVSKDDKTEIKNLFNTLTRWVFMINLPLTILLIIFAKQFINFFFGAQYLSATMPLILLSFGHFTYTIFFTNEEILKSINKTKFLLFTNLIAATFNIVLNLYLIPKYGIIGAAIATTSAYVIRGLILLIGTYNYTKLLTFKIEHIKPLVSCILLIIPLIYLLDIYDPKFYMVIVLGIIFLLIYTLLLFILKAFKKEDYMIINAIKNKLRNI